MLGPQVPINHPLVQLFASTVDEVMRLHVASHGQEPIRDYLTRLLVEFMRAERLDAIKDSEGRPLRTLSEMMAAGDVRQNADSFEQEREVNRLLGDLILFGSGVMPAYLHRMPLGDGWFGPADYTEKGRESYEVVSSFDYGDFANEADLFRALAEQFDDYVWVLKRVTERVPLYAA
ncbi:MAG: hypothetical protein KF812_11545 [Fimbriimonadaceae bacterium]|nr:hypothetical protein [Fimbriimonadaceae bacterium]